MRRAYFVGIVLIVSLFHSLLSVPLFADYDDPPPKPYYDRGWDAYDVADDRPKERCVTAKEIKELEKMIKTVVVKIERIEVILEKIKPKKKATPSG